MAEGGTLGTITESKEGAMGGLPDLQTGIHADLDDDRKAEVLIEALPWLEEFSGQRIVVKYGGNALSLISIY